MEAKGKIMPKKIGKFRNKTLSIICLSLLVYGDQRSFSQESKSKKLDRTEKIEKELELVKKELSTIKNEFSTFKEEVLNGKIKTNPQKSIPEKKEPNLVETKPLEPNTKSLKKYDIKSKGMRIQNLEDNEGKRYAIVVGINNYKDTAISQLSKARNDAKLVGKILKDEGQFDQVFVMTDDIDPRADKDNLYPTKLNIEEKLDSVLRFSNPEDLIVFFFSGHGISDPEENGYLVSVDTVTDKQFNTAVKVNEIVSRFQAKKIKKTLLVLDACRDVLYASKSNSRNSILEKDFSEAEVAATFYSTKAGYYSFEDDESDYGVFTKYLVMGMEGKADGNEDGVVAFSELEQFVQKGVKEWSTKKNKQQKPFTRLHGEKTGDLAITFSQDKDKKSLVDKPLPKLITRGDILFRSTFIPGWGQFHAGSKRKGGLLMAGAGAFLGYFAYNVLQLNSAQAKYNSTVVIPGSDLFLPTYMQLQSNHSNLASAQSHATTALGLLAAFWIYNIIDAGAFTDLPKQDLFSIGVAPRSTPISEQNGINRSVEQYGFVNYTWRF